MRYFFQSRALAQFIAHQRAEWQQQGAKTEKYQKNHPGEKMDHLIISVFHSVRGVPSAKMERLTGAKTEKVSKKSSWLKMEHLIISMFHSVRGVPRVKMERLAGAKTKKLSKNSYY